MICLGAIHTPPISPPTHTRTVANAGLQTMLALLYFWRHGRDEILAIDPRGDSERTMIATMFLGSLVGCGS